MSRSYKKHSFCKDSSTKKMKKYANKKVRHTKDIPNGKAYRKVFPSWDISDWNWYWSKLDAIKKYQSRGPQDKYLDDFETLEKYLLYWEKCTKRK